MKIKQFISLSITVILLSGFVGIANTYATGGGWTADFQTNPLNNGWSYMGASPSIFNWDSTAGKVNAAWDSGATTSHYSHVVDSGFVLNQNQSFTIQFEVSLSSISVGSFSNYPLAIGLYNSASTNNRSANIIEWDYYPGTDSTYGGPNYAGLSVISNTGSFSNSSGAYTFITPANTLLISTTYQVNIAYNGATKLMKLTMTANGSAFGNFPELNLCGVNFSVDRIGVNNWIDDTPIAWGGPATYMATGTVDNMQVSYPLAIDENIWTLMY